MRIVNRILLLAPTGMLALLTAGTAGPAAMAAPRSAATPPGFVPVPDVSGDSIPAASAVLRAAGLTVSELRSTTSCNVLPGTVDSTSPFPGDVIPLGTAVNLTKSTGRPKTPCD